MRIFMFLCIATVSSFVFSSDAEAAYCTAVGGVTVKGTSVSDCPPDFTMSDDITAGNGEICCVQPKDSAITIDKATAWCSKDACSGGTISAVESPTSCPTGSILCVPKSSQAIRAIIGKLVGVTTTNPLAFGTVEGVLDKILSTLRGIIVILSLIFIVLGAIFYVTSGGDEGKVRFAKGAITASVIGLALGIAAPSFLKEIGGIIGWGGAATGTVAGALTVSQIVTNALNFLLSIFGILAVIMLVVGGVMYLSSAGDEDRIDTAKKTIKWAIVGIVISFSAVVIVQQIADLLLAA